MLRSFIENDENLENTESVLVVTRQSEEEVTRGKELLTMKDMVQKGFSQTFGRKFSASVC